MRRLRAIALSVAAVLAGCSGVDHAIAPTNLTNIASRAFSTNIEANSPKGHLFVVNGGTHTVTKYPAVSGALKATITQGLDEPHAAAVASDGSLYVSSTNWISVYAPGKVSPKRKVTAGIEGVGSFALDANDWLYVSTNPQTINVYQAGSGTVSHSITGLQIAPIALAFDKPGNLYALQQYGTRTTTFSAITEYGPQGGSLIRTIKKGLSGTSAIALDGNGLLYALNRTAGNVKVYAVGATKPSRTIKTSNATAIAVDSQNNLYISDFDNNTVAVYKPGSSTPLRTISAGLHKPRAFAFDNNDNLYVGNSLSVSVYRHGTSKMIAVVKKSAGVQGVLNIAFGP